MTLQWRQLSAMASQITDHSSVVQQFRRVNTKEITKVRIAGRFWREPIGEQVIPYKGPAMQKTFPYHDIIMNLAYDSVNDLHINETSWNNLDALTHCSLVTPYATEIWVNIGSANGLLPDGTKPLPDPMLTYRHWGHSPLVLHIYMC